MSTKQPLHHYRVGDEIVVSEQPPGNASHLAQFRDEETAAFFVRCVNSHEALVEAVQTALAIEESVTQGQYQELRVGYVDKLRAALATAEPVPPEEGK